MRTSLIRLAVGLGTVAAVVIPGSTVAASGSGALYNSTVPVASVGNLASEGPEAYSFNEFGNEVNLAGTHLGKVTVMLSSWGCVSGTWYNDNCGTPSGSTFSQPITFNIYNAPALGTYTPGSQIATQTQTFNIPYRPSANFAHCNAGNGKAGEWWDKALASCFNGKAFDIKFTFNITLPSTDVVFGMTFNTTHYGYAPVGESAPCYSTSAGCPYDSLNFALTQDPTNVRLETTGTPARSIRMRSMDRTTVTVEPLASACSAWTRPTPPLAGASVPQAPLRITSPPSSSLRAEFAICPAVAGPRVQPLQAARPHDADPTAFVRVRSPGACAPSAEHRRLAPCGFR